MGVIVLDLEGELGAPRPSSSGKKVEDLWLKSQIQAPHQAKQNPIFKWRRVEGRTHYLPSLEDCDWSKGRVTDGFLGYKKKRKRKLGTLINGS